jgi:hypothetical protein
MTQDPYLPDGCTQADIDRAMGAMDPALECDIDDALGHLQKARHVLAALYADAQTYREAFRKASRRYDDAARELSKIRGTSDDFVRAAIDQALTALDDLPFDDVDPAFPAQEALAALPADEELETEMKEKWEENHG